MDFCRSQIWKNFYAATAGKTRTTQVRFIYFGMWLTTKFEGFLKSDRIRKTIKISYFRDINYVDIDLGHNVHNIPAKKG